MNKARIFLVPFLAISIGSLAGCKKKHGFFDIYWKNYDGSILEIDKSVEEESLPEFNGKTPLRAQSDSTVYTFDGWDPEVTPVAKETEYVAKFKETPRQYKITWLNYNDDFLDEEDVDYGVVPEYKGRTPTRDSTLSTDYTWSGWDREIVAVTGNMTYKATFTDKVFDVVKIVYYFPDDLAHEVVNDNEKLKREGQSVTLKDASCAGYDFGGWYLDEGYTKKVTSLPNLSIDVVLYGKFDIHTYTISYELNGGEVATANPVEITCLDKATLNNPTKIGYEFKCWKDAKGNEVTELEDVCEDVSLTAIFEANEYKITLRYSEQDDKYIDIKYDEEVKLDKPSKNGYNFLGWFYENDPTKEFDLETYTLLEDVTLIQKWSPPIEYDITYELDDGENPVDAPTKFSIVDQPELPTPTKDGYDFGGWLCDGEKITNFSGKFDDLTLTAIWIAHDVTITLDYDGGSLQRKVAFKDGNKTLEENNISPFESVEFKSVDDKANAQFGGWFNKDNQLVPFTTDSVVNSDVELSAKWVEVVDKGVGAKINIDSTFEVNGFNYQYYQYTPLISQKVTFESEGETDVQAKLFAYGKLDKEFNHDEDSGEGNNFRFEYNLEAYKTYVLKVESQMEGKGTAVIKATSEVVEQIPSGKITSAIYRVEESIQKFGDMFVSVGTPVKEGKTFDGWRDENGAIYNETTKLAKHNITLKAKWVDIA